MPTRGEARPASEVADVFVRAYRTLATERIKGGSNRASEHTVVTGVPARIRSA